MSYAWTGTNASVDADLGSGNEIDYLTANIIFGLWFTYNDDLSNDGFMSVGDDAAATTPQELNCARLGSATTLDQLRLVRVDGVDGVGLDSTGTTYTGDAATWNAALVVIRGAADASIYVNTRTNVTNTTGNRDITGTGLRRITCGETFSNVADVQSGFAIAECFVGAITPTTGEIDDFFSGKSPGLIWPSLAFYDPMTNNTAFNTSKRIGPTPSVAGSSPGNTALVAGHPTIDYGSTGAGRMLLLGVG